LGLKLGGLGKGIKGIGPSRGKELEDQQFRTLKTKEAMEGDRGRILGLISQFFFRIQF